MELLGDDDSKEIYVHCLQTHLQRKPIAIPMCDKSGQYTPRGIQLSRNYSRFIYCGVTIGGMARMFGDVGKVDERVCFAPDSGNFNVLRQNTAHLPNITNIHRGVWPRGATLMFLSGGECDPGACLGACSAEGADKYANKAEVQTIGIDEQLADVQIAFINLDIEGEEMEGIQEGAKAIRRFKPKLEISTYHKYSDIYQLPLLIHSLYPNYELYLRQFGYTLCDMVLFAIPWTWSWPERTERG